MSDKVLRQSKKPGNLAKITAGLVRIQGAAKEAGVTEGAIRAAIARGELAVYETADGARLLRLADIAKEELDVLSDTGLTIKDIGKTVSNQAKKYFFERENLT